MSRLSICLALAFVMALLIAAGRSGNTPQGGQLLTKAPAELTTGSISPSKK
ncbi:hypothetical protein [Phyllobacterium phragmitis]|uniref:hypothetical protein n=1 Tax=Phyllobacterium phragmitis TaxID=2670329 RepID=UPI0013048D47|nr:hypothetical protein [Phyllobacterium phragmitis]